jgi:hypothetical protein
VNNCGKELQPVFYVRHDDPNREILGFQVQSVLQNSLGIDMDLGGATKYSGDFPNFIDVHRRALFTPVFGNFAFNMYTGGQGLGPAPTFIDDLYDSQFIRPFLTNYANYNDALFNGFARGLRAAQAGPPSDLFANARNLAFAAEQEMNDTVGIVDVWTDTGPLAHRTYHVDSDAVLNGLRWEGSQLLDTHLVGAPLHDPNHPVIVKVGWAIELLDSPNPVDSSFIGDEDAFGLSYDTSNLLDVPWKSSLPAVTTITPVGGVCTFPNGETSGVDAPGNVCSVLSYQLRPDLTFAASLDGKIPAVPVTANDIRFSIFDAKNSPTSSATPAYVHVQDVVVKSGTSFDVYERNNAMWNGHDIGGTSVVSVQHWCQEAHDAWTGGTLANCLANPGTTGFVGTSTTGWPDAGVNVLSSSSGHQLPGPPVGVDLGSYAFTYDSEVSFPGNSPNGPILYRTRATPGLSLPAGTATCQPLGTGCGYSAAAPNDAYFTNVLGATSAGFSIGGWKKFHLAGNINWYCTATTVQPCSAGITPENGPLPAPDVGINIVDLAIVAVHFGETPGTAANPCANVVGGCPFGAQPWDIGGPGGAPDGTVNIFDLARVALHFGQSFLGGTDIGGGAVGTLPGWVYESIPGTSATSTSATTQTAQPTPLSPTAAGDSGVNPNGVFGFLALAGTVVVSGLFVVAACSPPTPACAIVAARAVAVVVTVASLYALSK